MSISFLFIVPLTPDKYLTPVRKRLRSLCLTALKQQSYHNWKALLIGDSKVEIQDHRFITLQKEGLKEEKLQFATRYIRSDNLMADYIIRLDDDDLFNPHILEKIKDWDFDIFADKYHHYFEYESGCVSKQIKYWFANTCIHKREHALARFGTLAKEYLQPINDYVSVIENDHSKIHVYYKNRKIIYASKNDPIYLRVINKDSITSKANVTNESYFEFFGIWNSSLPDAFKSLLSKEKFGKRKLIKRVTIQKYLRNSINQFKALLNYNKITFDK